MPDKNSPARTSTRIVKEPLIQRRVWVLTANPKRAELALKAIAEAGHEGRTSESGSDLAPQLREWRPDIIIIDMQDAPDRGRHVVAQLRADRATRQLPAYLVGVGNSEEALKTEKAVTGPTRRYVDGLDSASVLDAVMNEL